MYMSVMVGGRTYGGYGDGKETEVHLTSTLPAGRL